MYIAYSFSFPSSIFVGYLKSHKSKLGIEESTAPDTLIRLGKKYSPLGGVAEAAGTLEGRKGIPKRKEECGSLGEAGSRQDGGLPQLGALREQSSGKGLSLGLRTARGRRYSVCATGR